MRKLIPDFILKNAHARVYSGQLNAVIVNIDLIGFTALTQSIMQHSHTGVELLTDTINAIFTPAITTIENRGGYISGFAGDSFTALFAEDCPENAVAAAVEVRDFVVQHGRQVTEVGEFELAVRIGIACGPIEWTIVPGKTQYGYWYRGTGITRAVEAQLFAKPNEVIISSELRHVLGSEILSSTQVNETYHRFDRMKPMPSTVSTVYENISQSAFVPNAISELNVEGEFRVILSCFINLQVVDLEQIKDIIDAAGLYGGYISHIDCTDKGWMMYVMFGAPQSIEKMHIRAIDFSLELQDRCCGNIRIGLAEGRAYGGFIGSSNRGEYTGMGKAVNLAARFMMKAEWGEIWFDHAIQTALGDMFVYNSMGQIPFKGYPEPIATYKMIAKREYPGFNYFRNRFIGRISELERLTASCDPLFEGRFAGVTYIYGSAGQGKSRLIYELKQKLGSDVQFMMLQTDSVHRIALHPFANWIRNTFTPSMTGPVKERRDEFQKNWADFSLFIKDLPDTRKAIDELKRIESIIAGFVGLEWEDSIYTKLEPKNKPAVTAFAIKSLIEIYCMIKPVILILEDLQWLDRESKNVLVLLSRQVVNTPLKLIITSRPLDDGSNPQIRFDGNVVVESIDLSGLSGELVQALMQDILSLEISSNLAGYVQSNSLGNPFFVEQLTCFLQETDNLEILNNKYHMKELTGEMPASVEAILVARLDRLENNLKRMVQTASVLGCEFAVKILSEMLEIPEGSQAGLNADTVQNKLHVGEHEHIWNALSEISYIFNHSLLRDAAYGMQLRKHLRYLHLLAAQTMEHNYTEDKARYSEIAYHYEKADEGESAADYYVKAGDYEKELFHFEAGIGHYHSALNFIRQIHGEKHLRVASCMTKIGLAYWGKGEYEQTLPYFEQAYAIRQEILGEMHADSADNLNNLGSYYYVKGDYEKALTYYQRALTIRREILGDKHPDTATSLNSIGNVYDDTGDFITALNYYEQALAIRLDVWGNMHPAVATSYNNIADVFWSKGDYDKAMTYYEQALSIRKEVLGDKHPETAISLNCIGDIYSSRGEYEKALSLYEQALSIRLEILGNRHTYTADSLNNIGIVYDITGEFDKALSYFEQAIQIKQEVFGDRHAEIATILNNIGGVYDHKGEYDQALCQYERALSIWREILGERYSETAASLNNIGCAYENKGEFSKALTYYEQALSIYAEVLGEKSPETSIALVNIGCIYDNTNEFQKAIEYYQRALSIRCEIFGDEHPATLRTKNYITKVMEKMAGD